MADRRAALQALMAVPTDGVDAASSGCAQDGAHRLAVQRSEAATLALQRLDEGLGGVCLDCDQPLSPERLEAVVTAVRCPPCAAISG